MGTRQLLLGTELTEKLPPSNFQTPTVAYAKSLRGAQNPNPLGTQAANQTLYDPSGSDPQGVNLEAAADASNGFFVIDTRIISLTAASADWCTVSLREGTDAGNVSISPVNDANDPHRYQPETRIELGTARASIEGMIAPSQPDASRDAEWGHWFGATSGSTCTMYGSTLIILPANKTRSAGGYDPPGPFVGVSPGSSFVRGIAGTFKKEYDPQPPLSPGEDQDQSANWGVWRVEHGEEDYLLFLNGRINNTTAGSARSLRWHIEVDGEDLFNVRTNSKTGGATRTGRGFQIRSGAVQRQQFCYLHAAVKHFGYGDRTPSLTWNRHESADNNESQNWHYAYAQRTAMLSKFTYMNDTNAVLVDSNTFADSAFSVDIVSDGTPIIVGFSTSVHMRDGSVSFEIMRDATVITPTGGVAEVTNFSVQGDGANPSTVGVGHTDNSTIPVTLLWVDSSPPVGTRTYKMRYRRGPTGGSINSMMNCRDDGSSGFVGMMFAWEYKFATENIGPIGFY
jgi:hypothetical protein